jgi:hypothetical protein
MIKTVDYINSAISRCGLKREIFDDNSLPTDINRISVILLLGEPRELFAISSTIMENFNWKNQDSHVIVVSFPSYSHMFPWASEFWSIPETMWGKVWENRNNQDDIYQIDLLRNLRNHFLNVYSYPLDTKIYWDSGLTNAFRNMNNNNIPIRIPSVRVASGDLIKKVSANPNKKVFCWASNKARSYDGNEIHDVDFNFWEQFASAVNSYGYTPIFWNSRVGCYDTTNIKDSVTINTISIAEAVCACRLCDCMFDLCGTGSFIANSARVNLVSSVFRHCFYEKKDYEIDDLIGGVCPNLKRKYYFMLPYGFTGENIPVTIKGSMRSIKELLESSYVRESSQEISTRIPYSCVRHCNGRPLTAKYVKIFSTP